MPELLRRRIGERANNAKELSDIAFQCPARCQQRRIHAQRGRISFWVAKDELDVVGDAMTILVTGGCGYIGSQFCHDIIQLGEDVVVIDDLSVGQIDALPRGTYVLQANVAKRAHILPALEGITLDACVHFAARLSVPESVNDPLFYYEENISGLLAVLRLCSERGIKNLIFSSSAAVYGEPPGRVVSERDPMNPINPYGYSKAVGEKMLEDVARSLSINYVILRYFNVAGADLKGRTGPRTAAPKNLFGVVSQVAAGLKEFVPIFGADFHTIDGTGVRDYVHVQDLASAHSLALAYLRSGGESRTLNCGYGRGYSVREVVDAFERVVGKHIPVKIYPRRVGDPAEVISDPSALLSTLPWSPVADNLDVMVTSLVSWNAR